MMLDPNVLYRCVVVAINSAGGASEILASDGFTFDETYPIGGQVTETIDYIVEGWKLVDPALSTGSSFDADYTPDDTRLVVLWQGFRDEEYENIARYEAGFGRCAEWEELRLEDVNASTNLTAAPYVIPGTETCVWSNLKCPSCRSSCRLPHNSTYCAVVRAMNTHGLWGQRIRSNGVTVCTLGPVAGTVSDGVSGLYGEEMDFTCNATSCHGRANDISGRSMGM